MPKRKESDLLVETLLKEEEARKKRREQDHIDSQKRAVNRLGMKKENLEVDVQNLAWEKKKLEVETRQLKVEKARAERTWAKQGKPEPNSRRKNFNIPSSDPKGAHTEGTQEMPKASTRPPTSPASPKTVFDRAFPSPPPSTSSASPTSPRSPSSPDTTPPVACSIPSRSTYEPFIPQPDSPKPRKTPPSTKKGSSPEPYIPEPVKPSTSGIRVPAYLPLPIVHTIENNPIQSFKDRPDDYWTRFALAIRAGCLLGRRKFRNPADGLMFRVLNYPGGTIRVLVNKEWHLVDLGRK